MVTQSFRRHRGMWLGLGLAAALLTSVTGAPAWAQAEPADDDLNVIDSDQGDLVVQVDPAPGDAGPGGPPQGDRRPRGEGGRGGPPGFPGGGPGGPGGFGGPGGGRFGRRFGDPNSFLFNLRRDEEFRERLDLSEEQQQQLDSIGLKVFEVFRDRELSEDERMARLKEIDQEASQVLNPEQVTKWEAQKVKANEEWNQGDANGGGPPGPPGFGGPGGPGGMVQGQAGPRRAPMAFPATPDNIAPEDVRASFGSPAPRASEGTAGPAVDGIREEARLSFNFRFAPWADVLRMFAEVAGLTPDLTVVPPGTFNYFDDRSYTATQALDVLNGYLLPKGYILIRRDRFLVCINIDDGIPPNLVPSISPEELSTRGRNELVTVIIPLNGGEAAKVVPELGVLLGPQGKAAALNNTNSVVVTDLASNAQRIYALLTAGNAVDTRETAFKAIPLKHIPAAVAESMVRRLFGLNPTMTASTGSSPSNSAPQMPMWDPRFGPPGMFPGGDWRERFRDGGDRGSRNGGSSAPSTGSNTQTRSGSGASTTPSPFAGKIQITADTRTNTLLVTASAALLKVVEETVATLDTDKDSAGNPIQFTDNPISRKVYDVGTGDATQVALTLSNLMPGLMVIDDPRSGKLFVDATASEHAEIEGHLKLLTGDGASSVMVVTLRKIDPVAGANTLNNLFAGEGVRAPSIEADAAGRRLMIRGTPDQLAQVRALLTQLGEIEDGKGDGSGRGPVRRLNLGGRDPEEFLPLLKDFWSASGPNPIRVVVPSAPSPVKRQRVPSLPEFDDSPALRDDVLPQTQRLRPSSSRAPADPARPSSRKPLDDRSAEQSIDSTQPSGPLSRSTFDETEANADTIAVDGPAGSVGRQPWSVQRETLDHGLEIGTARTAAETMRDSLLVETPSRRRSMISSSRSRAPEKPAIEFQYIRLRRGLPQSDATNEGDSGEPARLDQVDSFAGVDRFEDQDEALEADGRSRTEDPSEGSGKAASAAAEGDDPEDRAVEDFLKSFVEPAAGPAMSKPAMTEPSTEPNVGGNAAESARDGDQSNGEKPASDGTAPIGVSVMGNEIIMSSSDEMALDQLEELFENLSTSVPPRTRWTVFYLRSADATETAQMLERLFPQSTVTASTASSDGLVGSLAGGLSSVGRGLMNVTGLNNTLGSQNLRIVTDLRANALFVTGPQDKVDEVEQMLKLLDASELPADSLRDRVPRSIPVEYANVDEVAEIVESTFPDKLESEQQAQQPGGRNFNPLAMLMGGAAGNQGTKPRGPELTVGVDRRTSHLIVACNDSLFQQVESLVMSIDDRVRDSRETVRVVPLYAADPALVSSTLSTLMPRVSVSTTRSRSPSVSRTGESAPASGGSTPDAVRDPEVIRRMMEQQLRSGSERGGGNSDRGRRGGFPGGFPGGGFPGFPGGSRGGDR
jgi:type II secretory pathway component GspD/PulD (secretin)